MYKKFLRTLFIVELVWCMYPGNAVQLRWRQDESGEPWQRGQFRLVYENYYGSDWSEATPGDPKYLKRGQHQWKDLATTNTQWSNVRRIGTAMTEDEAVKILRPFSNTGVRNGQTIHEARIRFTLHRNDGMYWSNYFDMTTAMLVLTEGRDLYFNINDGKSLRFRPKEPGCAVM